MTLSEHTVHIRTSDQRAALAANAGRFTAIMAQVEKAGPVFEASKDFEAADSRARGLTAARDGLNARGKQIAEAVFKAHQTVEDGILSQYLAGKTDVDISGPIGSLYRLRAESAAISGLLRRVVEQLLPESLVAKLRAESHLLGAKAVELERIAQERFRKTAELMRGALEEEGELAIDTRGTFSGFLLAQAAELKRQSLSLSRQADGAEKAHRDRSALIAEAEKKDEHRGLSL